MTDKQRMVLELTLLQSIALGWDGQIRPRLIKRCSHNPAVQGTTQPSTLDQSKVAPLARLYHDPTTNFAGKKEYKLRYKRPTRIEPLGAHWLDTLDLIADVDTTIKPWAKLNLRGI